MKYDIKRLLQTMSDNELAEIFKITQNLIYQRNQIKLKNPTGNIYDVFVGSNLYGAMGKRVYSVLRANGINSMLALESMTSEEVMKFKNFGQECFIILRKEMMEHVVKFKDD